MVVAFVSAMFSANAQSDRLTGQSYNIVMVDENGGDEIMDVLTVNNSEINSKTFSKGSFQENGSEFTASFSKSGGETVTMNGTIDGVTIHGQITSTRNGQTTTFAFRGLTSEEWNRIQQMKEDAK